MCLVKQGEEGEEGVRGPKGMVGLEGSVGPKVLRIYICTLVVRVYRK